MSAEPEILQSLDQRLASSHTALLIIDMQKDFCVDGFATSLVGRPLDAAKAVIPNIGQLLDVARETGVMVCHIGLYTLPGFGSDSGPWLAQRRRSVVASDCICLAGTEGAEFIPELQPAKGEAVFRKHRYSGFKGTDLDMLLRARGIRTVVPTGVSTNVCVESTLRDAFELNYYVCVPSDGVASWDQELHAATLRNVDARFGELTDCQSVAAIWNGN